MSSICDISMTVNVWREGTSSKKQLQIYSERYKERIKEENLKINNKMHNKKKGKSKINYSIENKKCAKNIKN